MREVGYVGAGTVEFLLTPDGEFHFLEMNTRLQVEHPVTEAITGLDLVEWQLRIARGEPLPLAQEQIRWQGHAIEARLCAEDAFNGFAPQAGRVLHWNVPAGEGMRIDHGLVAQPEIPPYYDSMIAKVIAYGADREQARGRLLRALAGSAVLGLRTNRDYLLQALSAPAFAQAQAGHALAGRGQRRMAAARARCALGGGGRHAAAAPAQPRLRPAGAVELQRPARHPAAAGGGRHSCSICAWPTAAASRCRSAWARRASTVEIQQRRRPPGAVDRRRRARRGAVLAAGQRRLARCRRRLRGLRRPQPGAARGGRRRRPRPDQQPHARRAGEAGGGVGQRVRKGEFVLAIEAMKMEHRIEAPIDGTVVEVGASAGTQVAPGRMLVRIEADPA